ncbi:MAG: hypothetical protein AAGF19_08565 [Pseudomonadota bacterium]
MNPDHRHALEKAAALIRSVARDGSGEDATRLHDLARELEGFADHRAHNGQANNGNTPLGEPPVASDDDIFFV